MRKKDVVRKFRKEIRSGIYAYIVLKVLKSGDLHGYAIRKRIEELTEDKFVPSEGTLYDILKGLQKLGLVESFWVTDVRPRKCYRITELGRNALKEIELEIETLKEVIEKIGGL